MCSLSQKVSHLILMLKFYLAVLRFYYYCCITQYFVWLLGCFKVKHDVIITPKNRSNHTAIQMMENGVLFSSDAQYIIMSHSSVDNMVDRWFSGEFITQIKGGTLSRLSDEDYAQVPSVLFSTTTGAVGVIVSLPYEVYSYLKNLEKKMRLARKARKDFVQFKAHDCIGLKDDSH